jgi:hypothetical protein
MWFHEKLRRLYSDGIEKALAETGYDPYRVDLDPRPHKIDNKIMAEIRRSRLLIADCTGDRSSVYFEAGFAKGLGIDVIWCCHTRNSNTSFEVPAEPSEKDWFEAVAFDTSHYPFLLWSSPEELQGLLVKSIRDRGLDLLGNNTKP